MSEMSKVLRLLEKIPEFRNPGLKMSAQVLLAAFVYAEEEDLLKVSAEEALDRVLPSILQADNMRGSCAAPGCTENKTKPGAFYCEMHGGPS